MTALEPDHIRLPPLAPADEQPHSRGENHTAVWKLSNTAAPFSRYILRRFLENQKYDIYETKQMRLIIESLKSGSPIGAVDLFDIDPFHRRAGVGVLIYDRHDMGQGYASSALQALIRYAFQILQLNQLWCNVLASNTASLNLFKSKGFTVIGLKTEWVRSTDGWLDEYMLQLINPVKA